MDTCSQRLRHAAEQAQRTAFLPAQVPAGLQVQALSSNVPSSFTPLMTSMACHVLHRDKSIVKQHQLVHKVLAEDISKWHGVVLETKAP